MTDTDTDLDEGGADDQGADGTAGGAAQEAIVADKGGQIESVGTAEVGFDGLHVARDLAVAEFAGRRRGLLRRGVKGVWRRFEAITETAAASENSRQSAGEAARVSSGVGVPSGPDRMTPASAATSSPAAMSHSLVCSSTPASKRPAAR